MLKSKFSILITRTDEQALLLLLPSSLPSIHLCYAILWHGVLLGFSIICNVNVLLDNCFKHDRKFSFSPIPKVQEDHLWFQAVEPWTMKASMCPMCHASNRATKGKGNSFWIKYDWLKFWYLLLGTATENTKITYSPKRLCLVGNIGGG